MPTVRKFFQKPDVLIVICVQIAVISCATNALQGVNHDEFCVRMLCQKLLDLLFQAVLERVGHNCKMQCRRGILCQIKEPCLNSLERIFKTEIQNITLCHSKVPERQSLRDTQAEPQSQPRLADLRCACEDMQALRDEFVDEKRRWFICPVLQIFRCDGV